MSHVVQSHPSQMTKVKISDQTWPTGGENGKPNAVFSTQEPHEQYDLPAPHWIAKKKKKKEFQIQMNFATYGN